jgi:hypothetical protein
VTVPQNIGQGFTVVVTGASPGTYYVRCLPIDFPQWTVQATGTPQASGFVVDATGAKYATIFDAHGVPVWWTPSNPTLYADLLPDGNLASITYPTGGVAAETGLNGKPVHSINNTTTDPADGHDLVAMPNGDYVIVVNRQVTGVNLDQAWGSSFPYTSVTDLDPVVEELDPNGNVVWSWDVMNGDGTNPATQIPVTSTAPEWQTSPQIDTSGPTGVWDTYHWNSIEPIMEGNGDPGFLLSFRHLDAVYNVDQTTKTIVWKLGGTSETGRSLTVQNDPIFSGGGNFSGQHDARMLSDGTVSIYDDGTIPQRAPRAVDYSIDTLSMTATLEQQVSDASLTPLSQCCGSARRIAGPSSDWVIGWGGKKDFSELTPSGSAVFTLTYTSGIGLIYRAIPITSTQWNPAALRAGMDAQYPPATTSTAASAPPTGSFVDPRGP